MSSRLLPDWIDTFMEYATTWNKEPPLSYWKWVAISCIASCLQRRCFTQWEKKVYPNFYIVLVGPSGCRKGTAMGPMSDFLARLGETVKTSPESVTREQLIRRLKESADQSLITTNAGTEVLMHTSLTIFSEELTVFLGYDNNQLISDLCNWYDCVDRWNRETKGAGKDNMVNLWVNLMGATTPALLTGTLTPETIGSGLTARIIFVNETHRAGTDPRPFKTEKTIELEEKLFHDLQGISAIYGEFIPSKEFLDKYDEWYTKRGEVLPFHDLRFDGYRTRRATHLRKLSMIMNVSRGADMELSVADFDRALKELEMVETKMGGVFKGVGKSDMASVTRSVMTTIARRKVITLSELLGLHYDDANAAEMNKIIETLIIIEEDGKRFCKWKDILTKTIEYVGG